MNLLKTRQFKYGTNAVILTSIVVVIAIFLYGFAYHFSTRVDLTEAKEFSLSKKTIEVLKSLDRDLTIIQFSRAGELKTRKINDLLQAYAGKSRRIKIKTVDPEQDPLSAEEFNIRDFNTVVFESDQTRKIVSPREIFVASFAPGQYQKKEEFYGEKAFTNAIYSLIHPTSPAIYFLQGHEEKDMDLADSNGYSEIKEALLNEKYEIKTLNFYEDREFPKDCAVLVIAGPQKKILPREQQIILEYIKQGGRIMILIDPLTKPGLELVLHELGVEKGDNIVVDPERGVRTLFGQRTTWIIPDYKSHPIVDELAKRNIGIVLVGARSIERRFGDTTGIMTNSFLVSSKEGWGETNFSTSEAEYNKRADLKGPVSLAIAVTMDVEIPQEEVSSDVIKTPTTKPQKIKAVVVGDSDFASNGSLDFPANRDFFLNSIGWLTDREESIDIRPKTHDFKTVLMSNSQAIFVLTFTRFVYPPLILLVGGIIWIRRRSL